MKVLKNHWLHCLLLSILVWSLWARTLSSYFLADDFGEVFYAARIYQGEWQLLWRNFTGNFMDVPGMAVWRPWLLVSLLIDFFIWKGQALGYYLTNLLSYNAVVLLFYWFLRLLTAKQEQMRASLIAVLAAALFAVSPLHCESISWVVGRVDIVCAVFYLLTLCLVLRADQLLDSKTSLAKTMVATSALTFWLSIWTKEMSIGTAILASSALLLFGREPLHLRRTLRLTRPLWLSLIIYFPLRYLALGTVLGGYVQGIGDSQAANALSRWLDGDTWHRLFFPFIYSLYKDSHLPQTVLAVAYVVLAVLFLVRLLNNKISWPWLAFLTLWAATTMAPLYKLWGLGYELEGARFCFFLTLPMAAACPVLLLSESRQTFNRPCNYLVIATLALLIGLFSSVAAKTNLEWVHAGKEVREFLKQTGQLNHRARAENRQILLLGIPKRHGGAHMLLNGHTFRVALLPPFTDSDESSQCRTFDPIFFAEKPLLDTAAFKQGLAEGGLAAGWNPEKRQLETFSLPPAESSKKTLLKLISSEPATGVPHSTGRIKVMAGNEANNNELSLTDIAEGDGLLFSDLNLAPMQADYLAACIKTDCPRVKFTALFNDRYQAETYYNSADRKLGRSQIVYLPLSQNWRWFAQNRINNILWQPQPGTRLQVNSLTLLSSRDIEPQVVLPGQKRNIDNYFVLPDGCRTLPLTIKLPDQIKAAYASIETTAANTFFYNFENPDRACARSQIAAIPTNAGPELQTSATIDGDNAFHQLRVRLLDNEKQPIGVASQAITYK